MQMPFFREQGLDLSSYHPATLNVSVYPHLLRIDAPIHTFRQVRWTELFPPEDFSFSPCQVEFQDRQYAGHVYYPHPLTKPAHHQDRSVVEVVTAFVPGIREGSRVELHVDRREVTIVRSDANPMSE